MVVFDTSALLYRTLDPANLSKKAIEAIDAAEQIVQLNFDLGNHPES